MGKYGTCLRVAFGNKQEMILNLGKSIYKSGSSCEVMNDGGDKNKGQMPDLKGREKMNKENRNVNFQRLDNSYGTYFEEEKEICVPEEGENLKEQEAQVYEEVSKQQDVFLK